MENILIRSRSVMVDSTFKKSLKQSYDKHKQKLVAIQNRKTINFNEQHQQMIKQQTNSKKASQRVQHFFDPIKLQNKAMIQHIQTIYHRRKESFDQFKRYKNSTVQNEKKEIQRQNLILQRKLIEQKAHRMSKKDLKKQFRIYEQQRSMLRKVNYQSTKKLGHDSSKKNKLSRSIKLSTQK